MMQPNRFDSANRLWRFMHVYEVRPRKDKRGVDLISDALPFGRLWYDEPNAVSNLFETHEHAGDFKEW
jgi:hypothetical protein